MRIGGRLRPWRAVLVATGAVVLAAIVFGSAGGRAGAEGPDGLGALQDLLRRRGVAVSTAATPPPDAVFFVPVDRRSPEEASAVVSWVRRGGALVLADPGSEIAAALGITASGAVGGFRPSASLDTDCATGATVGVRRILARADDARFEVSPPGAVPCFVAGDAAYLLELTVGRGTAVVIGGTSPLSNRHLAEADGALLAWNLLGRPGRSVVVATPTGGDAEESAGIWAVLPGPARAAVIALALASLVYAVARGRRFGMPAPETLPSEVPANELVLATADLYRRGRHAGHAIALLQERFRRRLGRRLGLPPGAEVAEVPGATPEEVTDALRPRPRAGERELVEVAAALESIERRSEGG